MRQQLDSASPDATFRLSAAAAAYGEGTRVGNMSQIGESGQLRWRNPTTRNNGKLKLAAVVHYDPLERLGGGGDDDDDEGKVNSTTKHDNDVQKGADLKQAPEPSQKQTVGPNSHVDARPKPAKKAAGRLSRLFFTKNNTKKNKLTDSGDLIDDTHRGDGLQSEQVQQAAERSNWATTKRDDGPSEQSAQVIEFKFDLIVEGDRRETSPVSIGDDDREISSQLADEILRPIRQRKLLDHVNELVESFVLDSMDVCLLTAGRRRLAGAESSSSQFDYLLKCAKLTITYAFQLLEATGGGGIAGHRPDCLPLQSDAHSIELEAVLFEQTEDTADDGSSSSSSWLRVVDLVSSPASRNESSPAAEQTVATGKEFRQIGPALEQLDAIRLKLDEFVASGPNRVLLVQFKLKQQVNGATFSNRMCLLDMSEPKTSRLAAVVETIFSGQALAHLKRQKVLLRTLEMQIGSLVDGATKTTTSNDDDDYSHQSTASTNNKHFHQIASLAQLIRAEWLIYKQLSSALIKTLAIVHCHRLESESAAHADQSEQRLAAERHLMDYNLGLLEFVHRLRRGSNRRLKRRKRHLRSHLARSDLGLISDTNLSLASSIDQLAQSPPPPPPLLPTTRRQCPRAVQDLMITSPFRQALPSSIDNSDRCRGFTLMPKDFDRSNQRRHQRAHHHAHNHHHRHHQHRHRDRQSMTTARRHANTNRHHQQHPISRASSLNRASYWATSELDMACDSSSPTSTPSSDCRRNYGQDRDKTLMSLALDGSHLLNFNPNLRSHPPSEGTTQLRRDSSRGLALNMAPASGDRKRSMMMTESDPDNSMASLNSTSLMSQLQSPAGARSQKVTTNLMNDPRIRRHIQQQQQQQLMLDSPSDSNTLDDSIELQSFSSSISQQHQTTPKVHTFDQWRGGGHEHELSKEMATDCISETCCDIKVAEPPRQLKLEEFLNQLSNFIGPKAAQPAAARHDDDDDDADATPIPTNNNNADEEEDDDCKSHSSILEHLSSLTLESNLKLVKQTQQRQVSSTSDRVCIVNELDCDQNRAWPDGGGGGHLQSLLKSTLKLQQGQLGKGAAVRGADLAEQLRVLTIDCNPMGPARVESCASQTNKTGGNSSLLGSSETPPTSLDSGSCVSSSSSSSSSTSGASPSSRNAVASKLHPVTKRSFSDARTAPIISSQIKTP